MPIHDLGYRTWQGPLVPQAGRFWVIAQTGIRMAWRNAWLRRLLFFSWLPAVYFAGLIVVYDRFLALKIHARELPFPQWIPLSENRYQVWVCMLYVFFRFPQTIVLLLVVGQIAPPLVAQDVRTKAFLLYFSRPLARIEYLLGKMAVLWFYLLLISAVPGLALYLIAIFLSPDLSVVAATWDLPLRIVLASAVPVIAISAVALALSSLTSETRYAMFAWFAFWLVGWATWALLSVNLPDSPHAERWKLFSMYHALGTIEYWIFGLQHELSGMLPGVFAAGVLQAPAEVHVWPAVVEMVLVTIVALAILFRRVSSPMRV
jgi:ABC-2 type transport system permease protein